MNWGWGREEEGNLERAAPRKMEAFGSSVGATLLRDHCGKEGFCSFDASDSYWERERVCVNMK